MARFFKVLILLSLLTVVVGCGQKGDLYMPSEQTAQNLEP